jgi:hypothetical protein
MESMRRQAFVVAVAVVATLGIGLGAGCSRATRTPE